MELRVLFVDMNAYFASVEQQDRPELRHRPVAVIPMLANTTCCIAASYEAKRLGVKTGTPVWQARQLCPGICLVPARPALYVRYHHAILEAIGSCIPVQQVHSIDEVACRLIGDERRPARALAIAHAIKAALAQRLGECIRCSIGIASNRMLAKLASDMQKPDGLVLLHPDELPHRLYDRKLDDFPSIGANMLARLHSHGIRSVEQLYALTEEHMHEIWKSVLGSRFWHLLRGEEFPEPPVPRRTVGHSHVLPPDLRTDAGGYAVLIRLLHKAAARLRHLNYWARYLSVHVRYLDGTSWDARVPMGQCQDTLTMLECFGQLWKRHPVRPPLKVGLTLSHLEADAVATPPLFPEARRRGQLARAIDLLNARFGPHTAYFADMHHVLHAAPMRISFTQIPTLEIEADDPLPAPTRTAG